jgi:SAM-dependent methyltransferase
MPTAENNPIKFEDGAAYEKMMGVWSQLVGSQFIDWLKPAEGQHWIDVGCGNGAFTEQIIERCSPVQICGIDPSNAQIDFAKKRPLAQAADFQTGDAMKLPFERDCFDFATMALVIFFVTEPTKGVAEMKRVVRPGGTVAAYVWDIYSGGLPMEPCHAALRSMNIQYPLPPSPEASKLEVLEDLWTEAGLTAIETKKIKVERTFDSFQDFWDITCNSPALQPVLADLSPASLERLTSVVQKHMPADPNGKITYSAHANAIKGVNWGAE